MNEEITRIIPGVILIEHRFPLPKQEGIAHTVYIRVTDVTVGQHPKISGILGVTQKGEHPAGIVVNAIGSDNGAALVRAREIVGGWEITRTWVPIEPPGIRFDRAA